MTDLSFVDVAEFTMTSPSRSAAGFLPEPRCRFPAPQHVVCRQFLVSGLAAGSEVLDVGCGHGELLDDLTGRGMRTTGVEVDKRLVAECCERGLKVWHGMAESLPFGDASFDAIVSSVVLPYTKQRLALREFTRVLRPGGVMNLTCHGLGYGLHYAVKEPGKRLYGVRMLANTLSYSLSERRLPGVLGDTLCQTQAALASYARENCLELSETLVVDTYLGLARFIGFRLQKPLDVKSRHLPQESVAGDRSVEAISRQSQGGARQAESDDSVDRLLGSLDDCVTGRDTTLPTESDSQFHAASKVPV